MSPKGMKFHIKISPFLEQKAHSHVSGARKKAPAVWTFYQPLRRLFGTKWGQRYAKFMSLN